MPQRIQRRRSKGWRKPENCVIVDRTSRWGNRFIPYRTVEVPRVWFECPVGWQEPGETIQIKCGGIEHCVALFRVYAVRRAREDPEWLKPLRGKDLACCCSEEKRHCHGDVLLELANREEPNRETQH